MKWLIVRNIRYTRRFCGGYKVTFDLPDYPHLYLDKASAENALSKILEADPKGGWYLIGLEVPMVKIIIHHLVKKEDN